MPIASCFILNFFLYLHPSITWWLCEDTLCIIQLILNTPWTIIKPVSVSQSPDSLSGPGGVQIQHVQCPRPRGVWSRPVVSILLALPACHFCPLVDIHAIGPRIDLSARIIIQFLAARTFLLYYCSANLLEGYTLKGCKLLLSGLVEGRLSGHCTSREYCPLPRVFCYIHLYIDYVSLKLFTSKIILKTYLNTV